MLIVALVYSGVWYGLLIRVFNLCSGLGLNPGGVRPSSLLRQESCRDCGAAIGVEEVDLVSAVGSGKVENEGMLIGLECTCLGTSQTAAVLLQVFLGQSNPHHILPVGALQAVNGCAWHALWSCTWSGGTLGFIFSKTALQAA